MSPAPPEIVCAHSPDSDDAYMFYALATRKIRSPLVQFRHVLDDIQTLNQKARAGEYELTAISYHAYPYVADKYMLMAAGSSIGDGYGPMVVAAHPMDAARTEGQAHRDSRQAHHRLSDAAPDAARFRAGGSALRPDSGRGARQSRRRRPGDSRSAAHLRQRRVSQRRRSGPLVERYLRSAAAAGRQRPAPRSAVRKCRRNVAG